MKSLFATLAYSAAVLSAKYSMCRPIAPIWNRLYRRLDRWNVPVTTHIHGHRVLLNSGYTYPLYIRRYPSLNSPLLELVYQSHKVLGRPITFVDVGAAIGDTVLMIDSLCAGMVQNYICIDGDAEFFGYLQHNVSHLPNVRCINKILSSASGLERSLIRTHGGTASAQGDNRVDAKMLDEVIVEDESIDVLKIDVDGFDGEVLSGAQKILSRHRPSVIFEWHPVLCKQTDNNCLRHFDALSSAGYRDLVWFTKYGQFSHFSGLDRTSITRLSLLCQESTALLDWHYDVVALPERTTIDWLALADLRFARNKKLY
jgi:FkbM family methyltransferase